jgi:O-antigen ligase
VAGFQDRVIGGLSTDDVLSPGNAFRLVENRYAFEKFTESPLWGHGFGVQYRPLYVLGDVGNIFPDAEYGTRFVHNGYMGYLVKTGAVGLTLFVLFFLLPAGRTLVAATRSHVGSVDVGLAVAIVGLMIDNAFEPDLVRLGGAPVLGAILGLLTYRTAGARQSARTQSSGQ